MRGKNSGVFITLINLENYFVFQPMLPEVISGSIQIQNIINPIRRPGSPFGRGSALRKNQSFRIPGLAFLENHILGQAPGIGA